MVSSINGNDTSNEGDANMADQNAVLGDHTSDMVTSTTTHSPLAARNGQPPVIQSGSSAAPQHPFFRLPAELILDIVDLLPPDAFINFAFANYPLLQRNGLAPALSPPRVVYITRQTGIPALFPLLNMPTEITLQIMRNLRPIDIMRFVVANYRHLAAQGIAPPMTAETERELRNAIRRRLYRGG